MKEIQRLGKEIGLEELKVLQMDVLQAIDEYCQDNSISYSLACGSMLGAVRHKGYIPWDDDIDIYMLRDDYEKMMHLFPNVYKDHFCISSLERSKTWDKTFAKAYDNRTLVIENNDYDELFGVNIDIFPIDEVPDDEMEWEKYDAKRRKLIREYQTLVTPIPFGYTPIEMARWLYYKLPKVINSKKRKTVLRRRLCEKIDCNCKKYRNQGYNRVFECCQGLFQKHPFNKSIFNSIVYYPFEDRQFQGFENYDEYLRNGFGDYMKLPPEEKRISHHDFKAFWKK